MLRKLKSIFLNNFYISLAAALLTFETQLILNVPFNFPLALFAFFATLALYNFPHGYKAENLTALKSILYNIPFILPFLVSVLFTVFLNKEALLLISFIILICSLYILPVHPFLQRLRSTAYLKIFVIAFIWGIVTVYLPVVTGKKEFLFSSETLILFLRRSLFIFAITIPFDIRDLKQDKINGIKTLPMLLGVNRSITLASGALLLFSLLVIISFYFFELVEIYHLMALLVSASITCFLISKARESHSKKYYNVLDGMMILQFLLVYLLHEIY